MTPVEASKEENENKVWRNLYDPPERKTPKFSVGDKVRISHTRTAVRECYKDDCESLWKSLKFDPSPRKNGSTDRPQICIGDYVLDISHSAKFCADPTRGFFSPYA